MGAERLEAIAVRGTGLLPPAQPERFARAAEHVRQQTLASPYLALLREGGSMLRPVRLVRMAGARKPYATWRDDYWPSKNLAV